MPAVPPAAAAPAVVVFARYAAFAAGLGLALVATVTLALVAPLALGRWMLGCFFSMHVNDIYPWLAGMALLCGAGYFLINVQLTRLVLQWQHFASVARHSLQVGLEEKRKRGGERAHERRGVPLPGAIISPAHTVRHSLSYSGIVSDV